MNKQKGNIIVVIIVGVVLLLGSFGAYILLRNRSTNDATVNKTTEKTVAQAGDTSSKECSNESCLDSAFQACTSTSYTTPLGPFGEQAKYTVGPKSTNGCTLTLVYVKNPNAAWVNKELSCDLKNTGSAVQAIVAAMNTIGSGQNHSCSGSLVALLQPSL